MAFVFQIHIDIPRTNPLIPLFQQPLVQEVSGSLLSGPSPAWAQWLLAASCPRPHTSSPALQPGYQVVLHPEAGGSQHPT